MPAWMGVFVEMREWERRREDFEERTLANLLRSLNRHLPAVRKTLAELLREEKPAIIGRDNTMHRIRKEELEMLASMLRSQERERLKIPIYIELSPEWRGIARIHGALECKVVLKILGKPAERERGVVEGEALEGESAEEHEARDEIFINRADVRRLRRALPTTTQYAFLFSFGVGR
ncbi:MAG: DUF61 family protein [Candidatus Methanospirare jalkutatii]|nr:DUF61 family protein [Candidatus Methanospirare jalkutatii]